MLLSLGTVTSPPSSVRLDLEQTKENGCVCKVSLHSAVSGHRHLAALVCQAGSGNRRWKTAACAKSPHILLSLGTVTSPPSSVRVDLEKTKENGCVCKVSPHPALTRHRLVMLSKGHSEKEKRPQRSRAKVQKCTEVTAPMSQTLSHQDSRRYHLHVPKTRDYFVRTVNERNTKALKC